MIMFQVNHQQQKEILKYERYTDEILANVKPRLAEIKLQNYI